MSWVKLFDTTSPHRAAWTLDPEIVFLNHGSYGAAPRAVLERQAEWRERIEREPVLFLGRQAQAEIDAARESLSEFLCAKPRDLVPVLNATSGVNAVLRSLQFEAGDELLATNHGYNACSNTLDFVSQRSGAKVVVAEVPFPPRSADEIVDAVLDRVTGRTRFALIDHVTSPTAVVFPVARLARELSSRGVQVMVDGAHAPGMLPLDLGELEAAGVDYYTGNCHKWLCAPKGAAFLWVKHSRQAGIRPVVISHGANASTRRRTRFHLEFDWIGTQDPTAFLCVPEALRCVGGLASGGWEEVREHNRALVLAGRNLLLEVLGQQPTVPEDLIGSIASLRLPDGAVPAERRAGGDDSDQDRQDDLEIDPLQTELFQRHRVEVPIMPWPAAPQRLLRISAQFYNCRGDYEILAGALAQLKVGQG